MDYEFWYIFLKSKRTERMESKDKKFIMEIL